jgi:cell division septation protein DedD
MKADASAAAAIRRSHDSRGASMSRFARIRGPRERGGTFLGLVIGVALGLGVAAAVALFVTKATVPFISKPPKPVLAADAEGAKLPDPNKSLYSKDAPSLSATTPPSSALPSNTVIAPPPMNVAPGADGKAPVVERSATDTNITMLQAGAFSNADDAESMRGKLALLGFESRVQPADRDGSRIFRVRLGPYSRIDDLNRTRQRLIENGVEATLVPPGR